MSNTIPKEVERQIDRMTEAFRNNLIDMYKWSNNEVTQGPTAKRIEGKIRKWIQQIGQDTQMLLLGGMDRNRRKGKQKCPECEQGVYWKGYEPRNYITSLGEMKLERAYYYHAACHCGWVPLDKRLKIGASELSPWVQEMVSYLGAFMPFEQAQDFLSKYCNIHISHDTVNNTTVAIGQCLSEKQDAAVCEAWEDCILPDCEVDMPPKHLYVSADGIIHLLPDGQGREIKVSAVYETEERQNKKGESDIHAINIEYVVHAKAEELARATYLIARKRGVEEAQEIIVLGDGAEWIWNRIAFMYSRKKTTKIVDFYHASEYIWDVSNAVFGKETPKSQEWGKRYCHKLKHNGPAPVLEALQILSSATETTLLPIERAITYFTNQASRMNYPACVEQGFQIGSGSAESGVKQVVGTRINQAGMRWNPERAKSVAHVRAAILSNRWDDFWTDFFPPPRQYNRKDLPLAH